MTTYAELRSRIAEYMTRVVINEDCGNSPKNIVVQELTIAFAKGDSKFILNSVTDDIRWNVVGDQVVQGKDFETAQVREEFERIRAVGGSVIREPYEMGGGWIATLADPDGNFFQLVTPMG
jgi:hypothetical protein